MNSRTATAALYATFFATGVGCVLPGALLPRLLVRWALSDTRAGILLFLFFLGSTTGALLSRGKLAHSAARGTALAAVGLAALTAASGMTAFFAIPLFGLGLGIAMTSVSLLQSRRHAADRTSEMARLNVTWSLGACAGPTLVLGGAARTSVSTTLLAAAAAFAILSAAVWTLVHTNPAETPLPTSKHHTAGTPTRFPILQLLLLALIPLATGVESAAGSWLTTFSGRTGDTLRETIGAATFLWAGMLFSRLLQSSRRIGRDSTRLALLACPAVMAVSLAFLAASHPGPLLLLWAFLLGFGAGPTYPLFLALTLARGEAGNAPFVLAGCGAALFPMLTGVVSGATHSLRTGLLVPLAAAILMSILAATAAARKADQTPTPA